MCVYFQGREGRAGEEEEKRREREVSDLVFP